jgi:hypothetical protein
MIPDTGGLASIDPSCSSNSVSIRFRFRPVADACGSPVLRDQGPIGRPGAARPIKAWASQPASAKAPAADLARTVGRHVHDEQQG